MLRTSVIFVAIMASVPALSQQAAAPAVTTPPPRVPPLPAPPVLRSYDPFVNAFRARGSFRNGINANNLPPQAIYYVDSYQKAEQTSRCMVAQAGDTRSASGFWAARPNSPAEAEYLSDWARRAQGCYAAGLEAPRSLLRGALAEAELDRNKLRQSRAAATSRQLTAFFVAEAKRRRSSNGADQTLSALASCVAPLAQPQMALLLATRHGSKEEQSAMDRVLANGASCIAGDWHLPTGGGTSFLRAYLAEASFRWNRFSAV